MDLGTAGSSTLTHVRTRGRDLGSYAKARRCRFAPGFKFVVGAFQLLAVFSLWTAVPCLAWHSQTGMDPAVSSDEEFRLTETEAMLNELHSLRSELAEKNEIIESLSGALKGLRQEIHRCEHRNSSLINLHRMLKTPRLKTGLLKKLSALAGRARARQHLEVNGYGAEQEGQTEWIYGVPSGRRKIVIELGANNGEWIAQFLDEHEGFWPVIVEPQPFFAESLRGFAREYEGMFVQGAAWSTGGEQLLFHAHSDQRGVGSSLFDDAVYSNGHCWGQLECPVPLQDKYEVTTIDVAALIARVALPDDYIVLRMDIEGAEYEVARRLLTSGVACWLDEWELEVHAMYAPQNHKFRPVDSVLPWIVRDCGVNMTVFQLYKFDEKLRQLRARAADECAGAKYDNDEGCSQAGWCTGIQ